MVVYNVDLQYVNSEICFSTMLTFAFNKFVFTRTYMRNYDLRRSEAKISVDLR